MRPGAFGELPAIGTALADDLADRREVVAEHIVQEEDGSLFGESDSRSTRNASESESKSATVSATSGHPGQRLGQPRSDVLLSPTRADPS